MSDARHAGDSNPHNQLRVVALDHFFDQDLSALEAHPALDVRRIHYQRLRLPALRMLGHDVGTGLEAFNRPQYAMARQRYATWLADEVARIYLEAAFDVFVLPSDTFFYVRALPAATHRLGIPLVVVQKETTISADTMEHHSRIVGAEAGFISDRMTVCSERHREFWIRTGANAERIVVTGQPRFDIYNDGTPMSRSDLLCVLFLTYHLDAYVPGVGQGMGLRTWEPLRTGTERVLLDLAAAGRFRLTIKCHPQQQHGAEVTRLRALSGALWGDRVTVAEPDADTRRLIVDADVVIGFQTTALYEAVAAGKPVVYAAWGDEFEKYRDALIPFHEAAPDCVHWAQSPADLTQLLDVGTPPPPARCTPWYEEALGPIDGHATERVVRLLTRIASSSSTNALRDTLDARRHSYARSLLMRAGAAGALWSAAAPVARLTGQSRRVARRRQDAVERRRLALQELRHASPPPQSEHRHP